MASDHDLMQAIGQGDRDAFEELYGRHQQWIYSYLWRMTDDGPLAADLRQEVFLRVWRDRARWTQTGNVRGYLARIARGLAIDEARRRKVRSRWASLEPVTATSPAPDRTLEQAQLAARVQRAIADLPDRMREVFTLKRDAGLSYGEIGERLGISPKTVDVQMTNALRRLRSTLADLLD